MRVTVKITIEHDNQVGYSVVARSHQYSVVGDDRFLAFGCALAQAAYEAGMNGAAMEHAIGELCSMDSDLCEPELMDAILNKKKATPPE